LAESDTASDRYQSGINRAAAVSELQHGLGAGQIPIEKPSDLVNFGRVERLPFVLAGVLGLLAAATLAHLLVSGVRRRRRDLAILKTIGFDRRQVVGAVL